MEWVETTGKTVEEAKDRALDQLGVDEHDAEFDVLEEPRAGLFGRLRGEARVRARVRPMQPRPKIERRDRRRNGGGRGRGSRSGDNRRGAQQQGRGGSSEAASAPAEPSAGPTTEPTAEDAPGAVLDPGDAESTERERADAAPAAAPEAANGPRRRRRGGRGGRDRTGDQQIDTDDEEIQMSETELAAQGDIVRGFLLDLLDAFGLDGEVRATPAEEGAVELAVTGPDLGLLIGPKGQTLQAIQELSRSVLQRQRPGEVHARVRVDVAGYRQRRREALERFTRQVAEDVKASGVQKALEPMSPPDRKVVHDTVNEIDGVHTVSEGEDARRRVVILPD